MQGLERDIYKDDRGRSNCAIWDFGKKTRSKFKMIVRDYKWCLYKWVNQVPIIVGWLVYKKNGVFSTSQIG